VEICRARPATKTEGKGGFTRRIRLCQSAAPLDQGETSPFRAAGFFNIARPCFAGECEGNPSPARSAGGEFSVSRHLAAFGQAASSTRPWWLLRYVPEPK
jgi:hypothetical protein